RGVAPSEVRPVAVRGHLQGAPARVHRGEGEGEGRVAAEARRVAGAGRPARGARGERVGAELRAVARAIWTGSLSFGLVNVPVQLVSAVRDLDLHFRQLHAKDNVPVETQRWCSEEQKEVPYEAITHSYELDNGKSVIVTDEDLEAV